MRICLIDFSAVCYTVAYSPEMQKLSHKDKSTGIIFGALTYINFLNKNLRPDTLVFCCDDHRSKRKKLFPEYKVKRRQDITPEKEAFLKDAKRQMKILREDILPEIGIKNIFSQKGLEGDDIIARVCKDYKGNDIVIVTSDEDMYQCLSTTTSVFKPRNKVMYSANDLMEQKGLTPKQWVRYKQINGCVSDCVPGIEGSGPVKTIQYILGTLPDGVIKQRIESTEGQAIIKRNKKLVKLPFKKTKICKLQANEFDPKKLSTIADSHGMGHIAKQCLKWRLS